MSQNPDVLNTSNYVKSENEMNSKENICLDENDCEAENNNFSSSTTEKRKLDDNEDKHIDKKSCILKNETYDNSSNTIQTTSTETSDKSGEQTNNEFPTLFNGQNTNNLSKSQLKKYKKMLSWEASKKEKRQKERLKAKQRKIEAKKNNIDTGPSRKQLKQRKMTDSPCKTGVIIDLSFDDLMIPKDLGKVIKQILRVYTENRRSITPMQLHLTSFEGKCKDEMTKHDGYENWDCCFHSENYIDIFPKDKLVYLTSESDNVIKKLEQDKYYIIGGLVDHNAHKGLCYKKAVEQGIEHGQLPISEFFTVKTRKVFTINQVFEILLRVSEGLTFKDAFEKVLPQRLNIIPMTQDE